MKIEIDLVNIIDDLVREDLQKFALDMLNPMDDPHETTDKKARRFSALCEVIDMYSKPSQYKEFLDMVKEKESTYANQRAD